MSEHLHGGGAAAWDIAPGVLALLRETLTPEMRTLETGAGRSTLVIAASGCAHACVTPSREEAARIAAAAEVEGISLARTTFHFGFSQDVLPALAPEPLDVVLIDGGHGFPIPAVDWQYLAPRLAVGGLLIIDDVDIWTGSMLVDFLKGEDCWRHEGTLRGRTAVFRLVAPFEAHEWTRQRAVVRKSRFSRLRRKAANAAALVLQGRFGDLAAKVRNERRLALAARDDY